MLPRALVAYLPCILFTCHEVSVLFLGHRSVRSFINQMSQRNVLHFVVDFSNYYSLSANVGVADAQQYGPRNRFTDLLAATYLQRVQLDGGGKLHPAAAAMTGFRKTTCTSVANHVRFAAFATPQLYSTLFGN